MEWIMPANVCGEYNVNESFEKFGYTDWRQNNNFEVGDIVFLYVTKPKQRIMYKTEVIAIDLTYNETTIDDNFWKNYKKLEEIKQCNRFMRLKYKDYCDTEELNYHKLLEMGLNGVLRGAIKYTVNKEALFVYINSKFK